MKHDRREPAISAYTAFAILAFTFLFSVLIITVAYPHERGVCHHDATHAHCR